MYFRFLPGRVTKISLVLVAAIMLTLSVGGCGSKYGTQTVVVKHYPACYKPISDLRKDESDTTKGTVMGALIGGVAGGVIGYQATGDSRGALIGGVAGAIIGGTAGYLIAGEMQAKSRAERFAAYSLALNSDINNLRLAVAAAKVTSACYEREYKKLNRLYNSGQINKAEMVERLEELRAGTNDANTILTKFAADVADNQLVYTDIQKREAMRKTDKLSNKERQSIARKAKQLENVDNDAQELASILAKREKLYAQRMDIVSKTTQNQSPLMRMAAFKSAVVL